MWDIGVPFFGAGQVRFPPRGKLHDGTRMITGPSYGGRPQKVFTGVAQQKPKACNWISKILICCYKLCHIKKMFMCYVSVYRCITCVGQSFVLQTNNNKNKKQIPEYSFNLKEGNYCKKQNFNLDQVYSSCCCFLNKSHTWYPAVLIVKLWQQYICKASSK